MKTNELASDFRKAFWVWIASAIGGSLLVAVSLVIHSDVTHAEMPYNPDSILGVASLSCFAAVLLSFPTVSALFGAWAWGKKCGWTLGQAMLRLQALHALGAAITFGIILYLDFDVFSVISAIEYPSLGALLWGRHVRRHWQS